MFLSNCAVCGNKKSTFTKEQEANGLLSSLVLKEPILIYPGLMRSFNPIQDGGEQKGTPPTGFSSVTSANVTISPQNVLTFNYNLFVTLV